MKRIELSEDFFPEGVNPGGETSDPGTDRQTIAILLGRDTADPAPPPRRAARKPQPASPPAAGAKGFSNLLSLPFELTRDMMTLLFQLLRASIPTVRRR